MPELILHHYEISSFAEKIRLILGLKKLTWRSVCIPATLPKPNYTVLTGGYRHTPSLQIGADIYCDTHLITEVLERNYPQPSVFPHGRRGLCRAIEAWAEGDFFWSCARAVVGVNAASLPPEFHADRAAMRGKRAPSLALTQQAGSAAAAQLRAYAPEVENLIAQAQPFLLGAHPSLADFALYHGLWFLQQLPHKLLHEFFPAPGIPTWMQRVASLGHGTCREMNDTDAIAIARDNAPLALPAEVTETALSLGSDISIEPLAKTSPPVSGKLVFCDAKTVVIKRSHALTGEVQVHFPRLGYRLAQV